MIDLYRDKKYNKRDIFQLLKKWNNYFLVQFLITFDVENLNFLL